MMLIDEISIVKATSIKLSADTIMILTYQNHCERNDSGTIDRSKSRYRYIGRVWKIKDLMNYVNELKKDSNRLQRWKWPDDKTWDGFICTGDDASNYKLGCFLFTKLKKAVDWETGLKLLDGWNRAKECYVPSAKYDTDGYVDQDGNPLNVKDREALLKLAGKNFYKEIALVSNLKREASTPAPAAS